MRKIMKMSNEEIQINVYRVMKPLIQFIKESYEDKQVPNLLVYYDVKHGEDVIVQAPENYSEDDVTIYLGDKLFDSFPGKSEQSKKLFGKNIEKLIDMHFEYDSFEHSKGKSDNADIEWDNSYGIKNAKTLEIDTFMLSGLKFILQFESFDIKVQNNQDINEDLMSIFNATESSVLNNYPIKLTLCKDKPFVHEEIS